MDEGMDRSMNGWIDVWMDDEWDEWMMEKR